MPFFQQRPSDSIENIDSYHAVFADSLREIIKALSVKDPDLPKILIKYNIWYAFSMWMCDEHPETTPKDISAEIEKLGLEKKDMPQLVVIMTYYQNKAGLKPVQERDMRAKMFRRFAESAKP